MSRKSPRVSDRLEASLELDTMSTSDIVEVIQTEDRKVADAVEDAREPIARAIDAIAERLHAGASWFYVGAGTSGRIALVDAVEVAPTFGTREDLITVLMAGGPAAVTRSVEGAEDDRRRASIEIARMASEGDVVVGIAASGTTPFTVAALRKAADIGCLTIAVSCSDETPLTRIADIAIVAETGPEVIMGSTRMKAGTAQKMILNALSTGVMVKLGHVYSNLMIDMPATNEKLRERAVRMVTIAGDVDDNTARAVLEETGYRVKVATVMAARNIDRAAAQQLLDANDGKLRRALDDS